MADIRNTGTWQRIERGLSEMANLMSRGENNLSLVKGRQVMEQIVRLYAGQNFVIYSDLADTIEKLYQGHYIGKTSRDSFHTIRMLGNKAVHEGDNDAQDANRAYRLLEQEIRTFAGGAADQKAGPAAGGSRQQGSALEEAVPEPGTAGNGQRRTLDIPTERERVSLNRAASGEANGRRASAASQNRRSGQQAQRSASPETRARYDRLDDRSKRDRSEIPTREDRLRARQRGGRNGSQRGQRRPQQGGVNLYDILRILIPVICVILLVVLIRSFMGGKSSPAETSPSAQTESTAEVMTEPATLEPPTTEPETTAPAAVRYKIKGNAVNARYADNENRVYTQLADGTEIGEVTEVAGTDKVQFTLDGIAVTVNKNYIVPVDETAETETSAAQ